MSQFKKVALEVCNIDHAVSMTSIKYGLQQSPFLFSLEKRPALDFFEMLVRTEKYVRVKKACGAYGVPSTPTASFAPIIKK